MCRIASAIVCYLHSAVLSIISATDAFGRPVSTTTLPGQQNGRTRPQVLPDTVPFRANLAASTERGFPQCCATHLTNQGVDGKIQGNVHGADAGKTGTAHFEAQPAPTSSKKGLDLDIAKWKKLGP